MKTLKVYMFNKNIGTPDRIMRFIIALALFAYAYYAFTYLPEKWPGWIALIAGVFTLYEVFASWCILYGILGINSCPISKRKPPKQ